MAGESAFEKIHEDESEKADLGGVLEQLNLPPTAVAYVRKNQKAIFIVVGVVVALVVAWALYDSHIEKKISESSTALAAAKKLSGDEKVQALQTVTEQFSGTDSAQWAGIEIAQQFVEEKKFDSAIKKYAEVRKDLDSSKALYPLVTYGQAQAEEGQKNYDKAIQEYSVLKTIKGYESIGYTGVARIYEVQGKNEEAIKEFEQYQGVLIGEDLNSQENNRISEKISRLKAAM